MKDQTRNLNPHKPARVAMAVFGEEYASQDGGSMDFWDSLPEWKKHACRMLVENIKKSRDETEHEANPQTPHP